MNRNDVNWRGYFVAVVTPFTRDGSLDEKAFRENVELLVADGIHGFVVGGCTGEFWSLSDHERVTIFRWAAEQVGKRRPVVAGCSSTSTRKVIEFTRAAKEAGCDGAMITAPYYVLPNEQEIVAHFQAISDAVDFPIMAYNIPHRVGVNLTAALMDKIADLERVVCLKDSTHDFNQAVATLRRVKDRIVVLSGYAAMRGFPAVALGADGYVSSIEAQVMGSEAAALFEASAARDQKRAVELQERFLRLNTALRGGGEGTFPATCKAAMNLVGRPGGYPREPLLPLSPAGEARVAAQLAALGLPVRAQAVAG